MTREQIARAIAGVRGGGPWETWLPAADAILALHQQCQPAPSVTADKRLAQTVEALALRLTGAIGDYGNAHEFEKPPRSTALDTFKLLNDARDQIEQLHALYAMQAASHSAHEQQKITPFAQEVLKPVRGCPASFEFYAAHFLVGSGLIGHDLDGNIRGLAFEFQYHYERGSQIADERGGSQ